MIKCVYCSEELEFGRSVSRNDICPYCSRDIHCCLQCKYYDQRSYNECREVLAERVVNKEKNNLCEYFILKGAKDEEQGRQARAKQALEDLFKKK